MSQKVAAQVKIVNRLGMHARPAMMFVDVASRFRADVRVRKPGSNEWFDGKSIMQVMMLAATHGTPIEIEAEGADAQSAADELVALIKSGFAEE